ncbi:hypothetical protein [Gordonia sp. ABSL49_1]|uniref:DUF7448 domain-containing protein n=1 Tax=Gordonia sp. ABSL49_1 TaxID=2920941 RepID=UPI001F0DB859|nr:hypothetical protein [Gordonia sp. ABSL49_1]MCH5645142.1 hypothetical protein [Gordonia sp. ABSL49_1]
MTDYPPDSVQNHPDDWAEDDGTMPANVADLAAHVVGRRIVKAEKCDIRSDDFTATEGTYYFSTSTAFVLTLDDGRRVALADTYDCCAHTTLEKFLLHPERVDHAITGVATTDGYTRWHIFADLGDILELEVEWSPGNPFYYGYGFDIAVSSTIEGTVVPREIERGSNQ